MHCFAYNIVPNSIVLGNTISKSDEKDICLKQNIVVKKSYISACFKWTNRLSGNNYRVVMPLNLI